MKSGQPFNYKQIVRQPHGNVERVFPVLWTLPSPGREAHILYSLEGTGCELLASQAFIISNEMVWYWRGWTFIGTFLASNAQFFSWPTIYKELILPWLSRSGAQAKSQDVNRNSQAEELSLKLWDGASSNLEWSSQKCIKKIALSFSFTCWLSWKTFVYNSLEPDTTQQKPAIFKVAQMSVRNPDDPASFRHCVVNDLNGIRIHFVDENSSSNKVLLLLHGFPDLWFGKYNKLNERYYEIKFQKRAIYTHFLFVDA